MDNNEKIEFRKEAGIKNYESSALDLLLKSSFDLLNLITVKFLTYI
jgi:hypothetical protein